MATDFNYCNNDKDQGKDKDKDKDKEGVLGHWIGSEFCGSE